MRLLLTLVIVAWPTIAAAQQPFYTDDAEVTPPGKVHIEVFTEYDWLQPSQAPHLQRASEIFNDELPYVALYQRVDYTILSNTLRGPEKAQRGILHPNQSGVNYWEWYIAS